ncbi:MAG: hypothetical protein MRJ93_10355 [Nitrososphaeraceae archaeon]|nr:hypothetical protein [Nitrososphaeraceae archaeon]
MTLYQKIFKSDYNQSNKDKIMNECKHWGCNLKNNTCIGCGTVICQLCLKEPFDCKCEKQDNCCDISY